MENDIVYGLSEISLYLSNIGKDDFAQTIEDACKMLEEQEAVKPIPPENEFGLYRCGKCHHQLFRCVDKYCSRCGKAVKWYA